MYIYREIRKGVWRMSTVKSNFKNKVKGILKYLIFNVIFFGAFFALNAKDADAANVTDASVVFHQSNHKGNNGADSYDAFGAYGKCHDGDEDGLCFMDWYVQGTGVTEEDVVTFTLTVPYNRIDGLVVFERGYTSAGGGSYDAYKKTYNGSSGHIWESSVSGKMKQGGMLENLTGAPSCSEFETDVATYSGLKANDGTYYSLMCITENDTEGEKKIEIKYAYTIRNSGYGLKQLKVVLYYGDAYDPSGDVAYQGSAYNYDVNFVVSKPVNENQFTWIKDADDT